MARIIANSLLCAQEGRDPLIADSSRVYHIWDKKSLADADWTQIDAASTADYNFFKVSVEMK